MCRVKRTSHEKPITFEQGQVSYDFEENQNVFNNGGMMMMKSKEEYPTYPYPSSSSFPNPPPASASFGSYPFESSHFETPYFEPAPFDSFPPAFFEEGVPQQHQQQQLEGPNFSFPYMENVPHYQEEVSSYPSQYPSFDASYPQEVSSSSSSSTSPKVEKEVKREVEYVPNFDFAQEEEPNEEKGKECEKKGKGVQKKKSPMISADKRERNRLAAERYRQRGRDTITTLEKLCNELKAENESLRTQNSSLLEDLNLLRKIVLDSQFPALHNH